MEDLMRELIDVIRETNGGIDGASFISAVCSVISLTAIIILLKERYEKKRPYLQASFELIRSNLTCIVVRNVGEVPAKLHSIEFCDDFIQQLPEDVQSRLKSKENIGISVYPNKQLIISLNVTTADVLNYSQKNLIVTLKYSAIEKNLAKYIEDSTIAFGDYGGVLLYISEIDELKSAIQGIGGSLDNVTRVLEKSILTKSINHQYVNCSNMEDLFSQQIEAGANVKDSKIG